MVSLLDFGYTETFSGQAAGFPEYLPARVTAVHKQRYEILSAQGPGEAALKGSAYYGGGQEFPTVGDFVLIAPDGYGGGQIARTLARSALFVRRDPYQGEQAVAANFDLVLILTSLNQDLTLNRLDRYLASAWQSGGMPVVVLTKADLVQDAAPLAAQVQARAIGVPVLSVSAHTGQGLEVLMGLLGPGKTAVLLGSSGVGKSSLVNALLGQERMKVSDIRQSDDRGRHTTTHRQLIVLPSGAMLIDTPGMRTLGLYDAEEGLEHQFQDCMELEAQCRFADCKHKTEPGCAILQAITEGRLEQAVFESYEKLKREARYADRKAARIERQREKQTLKKKDRTYRPEQDD